MLKVVTLIPLLEFLACKLKLQTDLVTNEKILSLPKVTGNLKNQQNLGRKKKLDTPGFYVQALNQRFCVGCLGTKFPGYATRQEICSRNLNEMMASVGVQK